MSSAIEALGMSLPSSSNPALSEEKNKNVLMLESNQNLVRKDIKPRDIMT
jgi:dihydroxyacid dehydratase/phosphogluconate dehydratase